jgi:integrase
MPRTPDTTGIETRQRADGPRYRAEVRDPETRQKVRGPWRETIAAAKGDRVKLRDRLDAGVALRPSATGTGPTVREAWRDFLRKAERGEVWTRSGGRYAPKTLRGYAQAADDYFLPELGDASIFDVRRSAVQGLVYRVAAEHTGQTARNAVTPLCALYRYLLGLHDALADPTHGLQLPKGSAPRERVATPAELRALLDALPERDRAPLALAGLAGLRAGEVRALAVEDVDLDEGLVYVGHGWDAVEGRRALKHRDEGESRQVPIFPGLRPHLEAQLASLGPDVRPTDLLVPGSGRWGDRIGEGQPLSLEAWHARARKAWDGLEPLGLHEGRHSFASWLVLAGYDVATIADWIGHRHVSTTLDRYVKPMRRRGVKPADVTALLGELA